MWDLKDVYVCESVQLHFTYFSLTFLRSLSIKELPSLSFDK